MDAHDQTILVAPEWIGVTFQNRSHVTVADSGRGPYNAVYSGRLWDRLAAYGAVNITFDPHGAPASVTLTDPSNPTEWSGELPPAVVAGVSYPSTPVTVKLPTVKLPALTGTVCESGYFNRTTRECAYVPPPQ
eukprot:Hpha_TRINITY_DN4702_c0_g1::TRINITY_DN4702_c0_g1_i2::g.130683::m.130683